MCVGIPWGPSVFDIEDFVSLSTSCAHPARTVTLGERLMKTKGLSVYHGKAF